MTDWRSLTPAQKAARHRAMSVCPGVGGQAGGFRAAWSPERPSPHWVTCAYCGGEGWVTHERWGAFWRQNPPA